MAFTDLPADWPTRPLTEPRLVADVLDLLLSDADRRAGGLLIALCDADARLLQPIVIGDLPAGAAAGEGTEVLAPLFSGLADDGLSGSLLLALGRPDGLSITAGDRAWRDAAEHACGGAFRLIGLHVVTPDGSREVPRSAAG